MFAEPSPSNRQHPWWQSLLRDARSVLLTNLRLFRDYPKLYFAGLTLLFGVIAYLQIERGSDRTLYQIVQLFMLETGLPTPEDDILWLKLARLCAVCFFVLTVWAGIRELFADSFAAFRLRLADRHDIVCGLGQVGQQLVKDLVEAAPERRWWAPLDNWRPRLVVIERDAEHPGIAEWKRQGVLVLVGDATSLHLQARANFAGARRIFACTGSDDINLEIVFDLLNEMRNTAETRNDSAHDIVTESQTRHCFVHVLDAGLCDVLIQHAAPQARLYGMELRPFNVVRNSVQQFLLQHLARHAPQQPTETLLAVVIGGDAFAEELVVQIAALAHFPNRKRTRIVMAAHKCEATMKRILARRGSLGPPRVVPNPRELSPTVFDPRDDDWAARREHPSPTLQTRQHNDDQSPAVEYVANLLFTERPEYIVDESFWEQLDPQLADPAVHPLIVVCLPEDRQNFDAAVRLSERMFRVHDRKVTVYVRLAKQPAFTAFLSTTRHQNLARPLAIPFGSYEDSAKLSVLLNATHEQLARQFHQQYQLEFCGTSRTDACAEWEQLPTTYRQANYSAAAHALLKLQSLNLAHVSLASLRAEDHLRIVYEPSSTELELLAEMEHNRWMADRLLDGWRWGATRNASTKQRPQLVPWQALSEEEREKDRSHVRTIFTLLNSHGMCVVRLPDDSSRPPPLPADSAG